jgi:nitrogen fixation/metabolism regulation signal transduction histidine kinase
VQQVGQALFLAAVLLALLLCGAAALIARTVARPVRELVGATDRIASGDYEARLETRSRDEVSALVEKFNAMASALASQRADLERRRDYMEALLANVTMGVISTDPKGRVVTMNPAASRLLRLADSGPGVGRLLPEVISSHEDLRPLAEALPPAGGIPGETSEVDLELDGSPRRLRYVRVQLPDPRGGAPGWLVLLEDVTDLMRRNQLEAWAGMARAIAHEIKNPLTPIQLSTEHLERLLRDRGVLPSSEIDACLETVMKQVRALREISVEFSAYSKLPSPTLEPTDPVEFVRKVAAPYVASHPPGIEIVERYQAAPTVLVDQRVLSRALVNLVENGLQAMPDGGRLTFGVTPETGAGGTVLSVEDTGPGLSPDVRARLFEPYFSTKSSGTGLGLAIVRRAVEAHRGKIEVASEPGSGTTFRIHLPGAVKSDA